jgi:hypothetical protein
MNAGGCETTDKITQAVAGRLWDLSNIGKVIGISNKQLEG